MKKFSKVLGTVISMAIFICGFVSCNKNQNVEAKNKLNIVCTIFPEYDWTKNIVGENPNVEVSLLMKNGVDLHSFNPTVDDIIKISTCDVLIYVGGESDKWIEDALKNKTNKNQIEINLLKTLGSSVKEEEIVEGMEAEEEDSADSDSEEIEYDEHVWLSVKNAITICKKIENEISNLLPTEKQNFEKNLSSYLEQLKNLDTEFETACNKIENRTMIFCDRFPFRYFVDDYNLNYFAAFVGCSAESEASFKTIAFLANKIDELNAKEIYVLENSNQKIANTVISSTNEKNQKILVLDSLQSTREEDIKNGKTYIGAMKNNLAVLKK